MAAKLAGDSHYHQVRLGAVVGGIADGNGGPLFGRCLIGEGERRQHDVAELK